MRIRRLIVWSAGWLGYLAPRVIMIGFIVASFGLATFLVLTPLLRAWLMRMGA